MENCLLNYFIVNKELKSACDFNPLLLKQGNGIYELVRVISQKPLFLEEHIERFFQSLQLAGMQSSLTARQLRSRLKALIEGNNLKTGNIRFQYLVHPQKGPLFLAWTTPAFYPTAQDYQKGVQLVSLKAEREIPNAKLDNLPVREKANQLIQQSNVYEVLLQNEEGFVTEGSRSNVFFVKEKKIITPPLSVVLPGVTRSKIISLAKANGIAVVERPVKFAEMDSFDAVFLSGTSVKVLRVKQIDDLKFTPANPLVGRFQQLYDDLIVEYIEGFSW